MEIVKRLHFQTTLVATNNPLYAKLDMPDNDLGDDGIELVVEALRRNDVITQLDLSRNNIGDPGSQELESLLRENRARDNL